MNEDKLGLFKGEDKPSVDVVWDFYEEGKTFNQRINLDDTVKANENFYVGKQWEGVQANGLPTPVFNILKRVVGFIIATITTDNLKINVTALENSVNTESYQELVRIMNEEMEAIMEHDDIPAKVRAFAQDAAVRGDGCIFVYWDATANMGGGVMGRVRHEVIDFTGGTGIFMPGGIITILAACVLDVVGRVVIELLVESIKPRPTMRAIVIQVGVSIIAGGIGRRVAIAVIVIEGKAGVIIGIFAQTGRRFSGKQLHDGADVRPEDRENHQPRQHDGYGLYLDRAPQTESAFAMGFAASAILFLTYCMWIESHTKSQPPSWYYTLNVVNFCKIQLRIYLH